MSQALASSSGRSESIWRVLTLQATEALPGSSVKVNLAGPIVQRMLNILGSLIVSKDLQDFEKELVGITNGFLDLWRVARKDESLLIIESHPDAGNREGWQMEDMPTIEPVLPASEKVQDETMKPICLFPKILQRTSKGEIMVICQGSALFPDSHVLTRAMMEKRQHEEELERALLETRSRFLARRTSVPNSPMSPTGGHALGSAFAPLNRFEFS